MSDQLHWAALARETEVIRRAVALAEAEGDHAHAAQLQLQVSAFERMDRERRAGMPPPLPRVVF